MFRARSMQKPLRRTRGVALSHLRMAAALEIQSASAIVATVMPPNGAALCFRFSGERSGGVTQLD